MFEKVGNLFNVVIKFKYLGICRYLCVVENEIWCSNSMAPDELFRNGIFGDVTQFSQEWALFKVDIHAVTEAYFILANETLWLDSEWVGNSTTTLFQASEGDSSGLFCESH